MLLALSVPASAGSLVIERQVYEFLTQQLQLPSSSACGILANVEHESDFDLHTLGDNGTSFGLFQWHNERWTALRAFCRAKGLEEGTVEGQLQYLKYELEKDYPQLLATLRAMENTPNGAYGAAYLWCIQFERPSDMENKAKSRGTLARGKYWNRYHNSYMDSQLSQQPSDEEIRVIIQQGEVTVPEPPQEMQTVTPGQKADPTAGYVYLPQLIPVPSAPSYPGYEGQPSGIHPATAFACAVLFSPLYGGTKSPFLLPDPQWDELPGEVPQD